jgi:hypothetical protein
MSNNQGDIWMPGFWDRKNLPHAFFSSSDIIMRALAGIADKRLYFISNWRIKGDSGAYVIGSSQYRIRH